jgi:hypothetical protein
VAAIRDGLSGVLSPPVFRYGSDQAKYPNSVCSDRCHSATSELKFDLYYGFISQVTDRRREAIVRHGTAADRIPEPAHQPRHRKPDDLATLPVGDVAGRCYEELYVEHAPVARRLALSMVPRDVADDIVAEAFTRVLGAIRAGGGPGVAFRAYLLAAVRNTANDWLRASRRTTTVGDVEHDLDERVP